jgi:succinate dehydrogenase / fumarate reductase cytochrome b subunit
MAMSTRAHEKPAAGAAHAAFLWSRLGSILAVAPLGVWTVIHLWNNLAVFSGERAWEAAVTEHTSPVSLAVTTAIVLLPLAIHTGWGLARLASSRPNNRSYGFFANLKYLLQRVSAIGVLAFLGAHLWLAFLQPRLVEHRPEPFRDIAAEMRHHPPTLVVYLLGTLGVAYHLANGLTGVAMGWGVVATQASLRKADRVAAVIFALLLAMSWGAIYGLWNAGLSFTPGVD